VMFFRERFMQKYGLDEFQGEGPVVMFGMYRREDFDFYAKYPGDIMVLWCGSDGMKLKSWGAKIINSKSARHVVSSKFTHDDLNRFGISHEIIPFTPAMPNIQLRPRGDAVYHYGTYDNDFYKNSWINKIRCKTGLRVISAVKTSFTQKELVDVYADCFVGLGLTDHDGLPTTGVELGLMGRRIVHNGFCPHSIPYKTIDDVCEAIMAEFDNRHEDNAQIAKDWNDYINIGDKWLSI